MLALAALVVVSVYVWQSGILLKKQSPVANQSTEAPLSSQIAGLRNSLIAGAKLSIPDAVSISTVASVKDLPAQLAIMIPSEYSAGSFESVKYKAGKTGYLFGYLVNQTVPKFFNSQVNLLSVNKDFKIINAAVGSKFALIEAESPVYQVQIEHSATADGKDQVIVKVLKR